MAARLMKSGVGRFDSPKYNRSTPCMDMAISASSRMREGGTCSTELATWGILGLTAQGRQSGILGIERVAIGQGVHGGALDEVRRGQVRFAKIQPQHALHGHGESNL